MATYFHREGRCWDSSGSSGNRSIQFATAISDISQNRRNALRQWLCDTSLSAHRFFGELSLADRPPTARCRLYRPVYARAGLHDSNFHRLRSWGMARGAGCYAGHFPALFRIYRHYSPAGDDATPFFLDEYATRWSQYRGSRFDGRRVISVGTKRTDRCCYLGRRADRVCCAAAFQDQFGLVDPGGSGYRAGEILGVLELSWANNFIIHRGICPTSSSILSRR